MNPGKINMLARLVLTELMEKGGMSFYQATAEVEWGILEILLKKHRWNIIKVAAAMKMKRNTLYTKLRNLGFRYTHVDPTTGKPLPAHQAILLDPCGKPVCREGFPENEGVEESDI